MAQMPPFKQYTLTQDVSEAGEPFVHPDGAQNIDLEIFSIAVTNDTKKASLRKLQ